MPPTGGTTGANNETDIAKEVAVNDRPISVEAGKSHRGCSAEHTEDSVDRSSHPMERSADLVLHSEDLVERSQDFMDGPDGQLGSLPTPALPQAPGVVLQTETAVALRRHPAATATPTALPVQGAAVCEGRNADDISAAEASECSTNSDLSPQAPMPSLPPRHGVRVDPVAGAGNGSVVYQRYCHVYVEGELDQLVGKVEGLRLLASYYDRSNWCVLAEREEMRLNSL